MFVDANSGDNENDGISVDLAKATLGAAIAAASAAGGDQVIRVIGDGIKYRESVDFLWTGAALNSLKIAGYRTDRPIISGAEILTGWAPCVISDEVIVGANWPNVQKVTVNAADFPAPKYWRTLMMENGSPLTICGLRRAARTTPDFFLDNIDQTFDETEDATDLEFGLRSGVWYDTIKHPELLNDYADDQLQQTTAVLHSFPNVTSFVEVTAVSDHVLQLAINSFRPNNAGVSGSYALLNLLPKITQGEWGFRDNADGSVTFYCWPNSETNLPANMELAVRTEGMRLYRAQSNSPFTLDGINFEMFAGGGSRGQAFGLDGNVNLTGNTALIKQCKFGLYMTDRGFGSKFAEQAVHVENVTFHDGVGFGMMTIPASNKPLYDYRVRNCLAKDLSQTGFRMFGIRDAVLQDCRSERTSGGGHANLINFYQGCDRIVVQNFQGGTTDTARAFAGYGTNQASSRLYFLHCTFTLALDGRGYVDQNVPGQAIPTQNGDCFLVNCWVPHMADRLAVANNGGITVGRDTTDWDVINCVTPAIVETGGTVTRRNNILTNSTSAGNASETLVSDISTLHAQAANGNWSAAPGSILSTKDGGDVSSVIATLETWFPEENFRRDGLARL